jgi:hypothetical protein
MRIIKKGSLPKERTYETRCKHCGTVFEFQGKEARLYINPTFIISCPVCFAECYANVSNYK